MTATEVAQKMLNRYGFFVVWSPAKKSLGVSTRKVSGNPLSGKIDSPLAITGPASMDDLRLQFYIAGLPFSEPAGGYLYRAVAE